jgi:hypothetical protein
MASSSRRAFIGHLISLRRPPKLEAKNRKNLTKAQREGEGREEGREEGTGAFVSAALSQRGEVLAEGESNNALAEPTNSTACLSTARFVVSPFQKARCRAWHPLPAGSVAVGVAAAAESGELSSAAVCRLLLLLLLSAVQATATATPALPTAICTATAVAEI